MTVSSRRTRMPRVIAAALAAAVLSTVSGAVHVAPAGAAGSLAASGVGFGAYTPVPAGGDLTESVNVLEKQVARRLDVVNTFKKWGGPSGTFANVAPRAGRRSRTTAACRW